jgi:hypothetical protein
MATNDGAAVRLEQDQPEGDPGDQAGRQELPQRDGRLAAIGEPAGQHEDHAEFRELGRLPDPVPPDGEPRLAARRRAAAGAGHQRQHQQDDAGPVDVRRGPLEQPG